MNSRFRRSSSTTASATGALLLLLVPGAHAQHESTVGNERLPAKPGDFSLKIEPGVAIPLTAPQSEMFDPGGGQTVKALWALSDNWGIGPSVTYLSLPSDTEIRESGTAWTFGGSVRLQRSHSAQDNDKFYAISPWIDADALYVRTGDLNRPGFAVAVGLAVPIGRSRTFWLGPFVRYMHVMQGARTGFDNHDAKILSLGVSLEVGSPVRRESAFEAFSSQTFAEAPVSPIEPLPASDRDADGIPDTTDRCPDVVGSGDNWGCPAYEKLVIKPDKLELEEKLQFAWNEAVLQEESFPVLDEVVRALKDNKGFRVQVQGHTSSEGTDDHNQALSEARAQAVLKYLEAHGIERERLGSKGFSSSVPLATNATAEGRESNRRVEFVVHFIIVDSGSN